MACHGFSMHLRAIWRRSMPEALPRGALADLGQLWPSIFAGQHGQLEIQPAMNPDIYSYITERGDVRYKEGFFGYITYSEYGDVEVYSELS